MIGTIITALIAGAIVGPLARLALPGKQSISIPLTIVIGAIGSLIGAFIFYHTAGCTRIRDVITATTEATSVKPRWRGWLHLGMLPAALFGGLFLTAVSRAGPVRTASLTFTISAVLLFGISAIYHRGAWGPRMDGLLRRLDHSNIYLIIAGTYTPFAVTLLPWSQARTLLILVWSGAVGGCIFRVAWTGAPRWLYTGLYIALGWVAVFYVVPFWRAGGPVIGVLLAVGGLMYTAGGLIYGTKRPNPSPRWFGFHEVFHAFTLAGFASHFAAVSLVVIGYGAVS